jgi:hypothetical protein
MTFPRQNTHIKIGVRKKVYKNIRFTILGKKAIDINIKNTKFGTFAQRWSESPWIK